MCGCVGEGVGIANTHAHTPTPTHPHKPLIQAKPKGKGLRGFRIPDAARDAIALSDTTNTNTDMGSKAT